MTRRKIMDTSLAGIGVRKISQGKVTMKSFIDDKGVASLTVEVTQLSKLQLRAVTASILNVLEMTGYLTPPNAEPK